MLDKKVLKVLSKFVKPSVKLNFGSDKGFSKFGGYPTVPDDFVWPVNSNNKPIPFYFQIDFSQINAYGQLKKFPQNGLLYLFIDENAINTSYPYSSGEHYKIVYFASATSNDKLKVVKDCSFVYPEKRFSFEKTDMYPYTEENDEVDEIISALTDDQADEYYEEYHYQDVEFAIVGGWPQILQSSYLQDDEVQIFELQSFKSNDCEVMWGDVGMLQFYISLKDLKNSQFDNVKCNLETT